MKFVPTRTLCLFEYEYERRSITYRYGIPYCDVLMLCGLGLYNTRIAIACINA